MFSLTQVVPPSLLISMSLTVKNLLALLDIYCEELDELMKATHDVIDLRYR